MINIDFGSFLKKRRRLTNGFPVGMVLFTGDQGAGKTLSQSRYVYQLQQKWGAKVYSATDFANADVKIDENDIAANILTKREDRPTVFLLDEIQVLLDRGNLDDVGRTQIRKAIQQQRKRNTSIVGTLQVYLDIAPEYRRQIKYVVRCMHFGPIQIERWMPGNSLSFNQETNKYEGPTDSIKIWKRHNDMYDLYDTYQVVGDKKGVAPT